MRDALRARRLGRRDYAEVWAEMRRFTEHQDASRGGEIWLLEHDPVFTLGQAGRPQHLLAPGAIPVLQSDRGGQVTYHGPGQLVAYVLLDLRQTQFGVRSLVQALEQAVIGLLGDYRISAERRAGAPGVYVDGAKIAALGLRVRHGCSYHGLSLNVDMDLEPFARINPCGYPGLAVTQLADHGGPRDLERVGDDLLGHLSRTLGYGISDGNEPGLRARTVES